MDETINKAVAHGAHILSSTPVDEITTVVRLSCGASTVVEAGTLLGRLAKSICQVADKVYAIDNFIGTEADPMWHDRNANNNESTYRQNLSQEIADGRLQLFAVDTTSAAKALSELNVQADVIFIDADHRYEGVSKDIQSFLPLVKPGGILCGHDYNHPWHPGVKTAVDELLPGCEVVNTIWVHRKPAA